MSDHRAGYFRMNNTLLSVAAEHGTTAFAVLAVLCRHANSNGQCYPAIGTIAKTLGLSRRTVQSAIRTLECAQVISVTAKNRDGRTLSNCYHVPIAKGETDCTHAADRTGEADRTPECNRLHGEGAAYCTGRVQPTAPKGQPKEGRPKKGPPPPKSDGDDGELWKSLVDDLKSLGVVAARKALESAQAGSAHPDDVAAVIEHYQSNLGAWNPGALQYRVSHASPSLAGSDGWPPPEKTNQQRAENENRKSQIDAERAADRIVMLGRKSKKTDDEIKRELKTHGLSWPS